MTLHYANDVRNAGMGNLPPDESWPVDEWHRSASADTGTSHTLPGRLYVVQCEWCDEAFAAHTKAKAMQMFRVHETAMLNPGGIDE